MHHVVAPGIESATLGSFLIPPLLTPRFPFLPFPSLPFPFSSRSCIYPLSIEAARKLTSRSLLTSPPSLFLKRNSQIITNTKFTISPILFSPLHNAKYLRLLLYFSNSVTVGASFSQKHSPEFQTAKVISINGELHQYKLPISVGTVLASESFSSSSSSSSYFVLSNSDKLYYEEYIPALELTERLVENQIYFVFPRSKLQHKLKASDMAALAVKASVAMQKAAKKGGARRRRVQISPALEVIAAADEPEGLKVKEKSSTDGLGRTGTARRFRRSSSRRLKKAAPSYRVRLSTIQEERVA